jgi:uncharacterized protein
MDENHVSTEPRATTPEERNWAVFCHLAALAVVIVPFFGNVIGPLVIWLIKKDEMPFVDAHGKEAVNFQITVSIAAVISAVLIIVLVGVLLLFALAIVTLVLVVMAAVAASRGEYFRYPFSLGLIR